MPPSHATRYLPACGQRSWPQPQQRTCTGSGSMPTMVLQGLPQVLPVAFEVDTEAHAVGVDLGNSDLGEAATIGCQLEQQPCPTAIGVDEAD